MTAEPLLLASPDAVPVQGVMLPHGLLLRLFRWVWFPP